MKTNAPGLFGLSLTLRQQMIAVAGVAIVSAGLSSALNRSGMDAVFAITRLFLLATPWVLAGLVLVFDRASPERDWTVARLLFAFYPMLTVYLDLAVIVHTSQSGEAPRWGSLAFFNLLVLISTLAFQQRFRARPCPSCARKSMIPLVRLRGQSRRINKTRWCASCGGLFWRDRNGAWRVERRATWVNSPYSPPPVQADSETGPAHELPPVIDARLLCCET